MIRIRVKSGKSIEALKEIHLQGLTSDKRSYKIEKKLQTLIKSKDKCKKIYEYLFKELNKVITGSPCELVKIIREVEYLIESGSCHRTNCFNKLKKVFNYENFTEKHENWWAYRLAEKMAEYLQCTTCPYCNRNFITLVKDRTRAEFDHFYSKSDYPYLALSLFNLIPACLLCNMRLRHTKPFSINTHIHPYIDDFEDKMRFTLSPSKDKTKDFIISHFNSDEGDFNIDFEVGKPMTPKRKQKIENNIRDFELKDLYNKHKDYATEILKKSIIYKPEIMDQLFQEVGLTSFEDRYTILYGNFWKNEDFGLRPLSKFSRDIYLYCHPDDQN